MVVGGVLKTEFRKDAGDVLFDGAFADEQLRGDRVVGFALGHQTEDLFLPWAERTESIRAAPAGQKLGNDLRVEQGSSGGYLLRGGDKIPHVGNQSFNK